METSTRHPMILLRAARNLMLFLTLTLPITYGGVSLLSAHVLTSPSNHPASVDPRMVSPDAVRWTTRTEDGLTLRGWYFPTKTHRHLLVLVHGMQSSWDAMAGIGRDLHDKGYDLLMFDLRGHGDSDPSRLSMGGRERGDLRAVLSWAHRNGWTQDRIGWLGFSMGASMLLMEGSENLEFRAAVVDSPYGDLPRLLERQLALHSHLPSAFNPGILFAADWAFGVKIDDLIPVRFARGWRRRPLLLIHGEADSLIPVQQARDIVSAAGPSCQSIFVPGVGHVGAYAKNPKAYVAAVTAFFEKNLSP